MSWKNENELIISVSVDSNSILGHIAKVDSLVEELQRECESIKKELKAKENST